jgi:molybdenum cofactor cytidylyltransferase
VTKDRVEKQRVAGVVLAAGSSSRMGRPKALLPYRGKPLLQHVIDLAAPAFAEVIVVLGHGAAEIRAALSLPPHARAVLNPDFGSGQASSLRTGLAAAGTDAAAAIVLMGDQPGIRADAIRRVFNEHERSGAPVVRVTYAGIPGHPVLLDREVWPELAAASGDVGARDWIKRHPDRVATVALPFPPPLEVDTEEDYRRLLDSD